MHRGEKPCDSKARQPGPDRLAADAEIPGADHGIGAADQIVDRQQSDAAVAHGTRLSAELSRLSPSTNSWPAGTVTSGVLSSRPLSRSLKIAWVTPFGSVSMIAIGRFAAAESLRLRHAVGLQGRGMIVDEELALAQLDPVAGQADDAFDPGLRIVARPAEHDDVAALRGLAEQRPVSGSVIWIGSEAVP